MFDPAPTGFLITDVGSTTTKAFLFRRDHEAWRFHCREAPTTVEKPHEDVTIGVAAALLALEEETGLPCLREGVPALPYLSTSSAGGGLSMVVIGLVRDITAQSAERVALGAGALVSDVIAMDDGRSPYQKIRALESLRPDMVLLAGGFDGEALSGPVFLAEVLNEAAIFPKRNPHAQLPVIYAGNRNAFPHVRGTLSSRFLLHPVDNLRPTGLRENLGPARDAIHELFMNHVMSQAPGYDRLLSWVGMPVRPTPAAFGRILALVSRKMRGRLLAVDIGGATTDVFTAERGEVRRTVSANLGMSYSILQVMHRAGCEAVRELLGGGISPAGVWNSAGNKHLAPATLPSRAEDQEIEWAVATVAIREAVRDHLRVLEGLRIDRGAGELRFDSHLIRADRRKPESRALDLGGYDLVIGSGGILSHSPREAAARILAEALPLDKRVHLAVDSSFVFPHLGMLSELAPELASEIFETCGIVRLGDAGDFPADRAWRGRLARALPGAERGAPREGPPASRRPPLRDTIRLRRELAMAGNVRVVAGQRVAPDAIVARATRVFLRPFFLNVARALSTSPELVREHLLVREGDLVRSDDVIARRRTGKFTVKEYRSPVVGHVEKLLADGTLVVREREEQALEMVTVEAAAALGVGPSALTPHLRCAPGQEVERDQWLALRNQHGRQRGCPSPLRGKVVEINAALGTIRIAPLREELEIAAWMPGTVEEVSDRGCVVANEGVILTGAWGLGGEGYGVLAFDARAAGGSVDSGSVAVVDHATRDLFTELEARHAAGLIAASADLEDLIGRTFSFPIVLTEGFGERRMRPEFREIIREWDGRLAMLDGTTELRVGVRRPRILLVAADPLAVPRPTG